MYAGSVDDNPENWKITPEIIRAEINKVLVAKEQHKRGKKVEQRQIGFAPAADTRELEQ
jgi:hypothetical protein